MTDRTAWLNGGILPVEEVRFAADDLLVTSAASVCETLRTFRHRPFLLGEHLARLERSAADARVPLRISTTELTEVVDELTRGNAETIPPEDDLVISVVASPGRGRSLGFDADDEGPTLVVTATPISARRYGPIHERGQHLAVPPVAALGGDVLPRSVKTRSRLHWYLADRLAAERHPRAVAVLADADGSLTETNIGNLFVVAGDTLRTPPESVVLPGTSRRFVIDLARGIGLTCDETALRPADLAAADEAFVTSSVICLAPVTRFEGVEIADGRIGPVTARLLETWSDRVGVSIAAQLAGRA